MGTASQKYYDPKGKWDKLAWEELYKRSNPFTYLGDFSELIRNQIILDFCKWGKLKHVLDVGCGEGTLTKEISVVAESVDAFDISANAINLAKNNNNRHNIKYYDLDASSYRAVNRKYDLVICSEMIYYLTHKNIIKLFEEVHHSICENGYFILTSRSSDYFSIYDILDLLSANFRVLNIVPTWRPNRVGYKVAKKVFGFFSPYLDQFYKSWLKSINPHQAYMCCFVCIPL